MGFTDKGLLSSDGCDLPTKKEYVTTMAKEMARKHRQWCADHKWFISRQSKNWERPFQQLINQVGEDRTFKCLLWYHNNHGDGEGKFRMRLKNGKEFRDRFNDLEDFIRRQEERAPAVEITPQGKEIAGRLKTKYLWPKGCESQLPAAVQITLNSWRAFQKKLKAYCDANPPTVREKIPLEQYRKNKRKAAKGGYKTSRYYHVSAPPRVTFAHRLREILGYSVLGIVEEHFRETHQEVCNWDAWTGSLFIPKFTWRGDLGDNKFTRWIAGQCARYAGSTRPWDELKEELK